MNLRKLTLPLGFFVVLMGVLSAPIVSVAAPRFTFTPSSSTVTIGSQFDVTLGVDSGTEKVIGIDLSAGFDASRLEVVSITKATIPDGGYNFTFTSSSPIIRNDTGKFEVTLPSANSSVYEGVVANHDLLKVTFRAKSTGVATVNLVCTPGSVTETNIINQTGSDVVDCTANQSGSYTINVASGGEVTATSTPVPTSVPASSAPTDTSASTTTTTSTSAELPRTGSVETTIAVLITGLMTVIAAAFLRGL